MRLKGKRGWKESWKSSVFPPWAHCLIKSVYLDGVRGFLPPTSTLRCWLAHPALRYLPSPTANMMCLPTQNNLESLTLIKAEAWNWNARALVLNIEVFAFRQVCGRTLEIIPTEQWHGNVMEDNWKLKWEKAARNVFIAEKMRLLVCQSWYWISFSVVQKTLFMVYFSSSWRKRKCSF